MFPTSAELKDRKRKNWTTHKKEKEGHTQKGRTTNFTQKNKTAVSTLSQVTYSFLWLLFCNGHSETLDSQTGHKMYLHCYICHKLQRPKPFILRIPIQHVTFKAIRTY
jgi:hypothetical protein